MRRSARIAAWTLAGLASVIVLLIVIVAVFDWNRLRPWVADKASDALQRPVAINGDLDVDWQWRSGFVPWPHITANDIVVGHPEGFAGSQGEEMAEIAHLALDINPMPLLNRRVEIPRLEFGDSRIVLERNAEGDNNWVYERKKKQEESDEGWTFDLESIALERVDVHVIDEDRKLDMMTRFNSLDTNEDGYGMDWESSGTFNDAEIGGTGQVGGLLSLREGSDPFPMQGEISFGETRLAIEGSMEAPSGIASLDVRLKLAGSSLSDLNALFGLALPTTPPYESQGRLIAMLEGEEDTWRYENFTGVVGESDLRGTLQYQFLEPRPVLSGEVASDLLRFRDLGPLIGVDSADDVEQDAAQKDAEESEADAADEADENAARKSEAIQNQGRTDVARGNGAGGNESADNASANNEATENEATENGAPENGADEADRDEEDREEKERVQPADKALPVARIGSETWDLMDADVHFEGKRIVRDEDLPLDNIEARVLLQDQVLSFEPLNFGVAGGTLASTLKIDGRNETLKADLMTEIRGLQLKELFPGAESMNASFGQLHGDARLTGEGDSIAGLLGTADGELSVALSRGTISRFLMEAAGLNVANVVFVKLFGDEQVMLECLVADFEVTDGLMQTRAFILETEDAIITVDGSISLKQEKLDLDIRPQNKTLRVLTLRSPLQAKGTFKNPEVGVQPVPVAARAGAAVVLGVVATPLAALLPLLNVGTEDNNDCSALRSGKPANGGGEAGGADEPSENGSGDAGDEGKPDALAEQEEFIPH